MKIMVFEYQYGGHFIEYLQYLISYAKNLKNDQLFLVLPYKYKQHVDSGDFTLSDNTQIVYMTDAEIRRCKNGNSAFADFILSFWRCRIVQRYAKSLKADRIILLTAINYIFAVKHVISRRFNISMIEYFIPRRRSKNQSWRSKQLDKIRYYLFVNIKHLKKVFLLNDAESVKFYNAKYKTDKFAFLPDPIDVVVSNKEDVATGRKEEKIILLHAGCFRKEKGTFAIIEALRMLPTDIRDKFKFILCGSSTIDEDNRRAVEEMRDLAGLMDTEFYNSFVPAEFLHKQYQRADYILIPYQNSAQSSGNLGHAASYGKPVIGPKEGLLGHLIESYKLGYCLEALAPESIAALLTEIARGDKRSFEFEKYTSMLEPRVFSKLLLEC